MDYILLIMFLILIAQFLLKEIFFILSSFIHPHAGPNLYDVLYSVKHKRYILKNVW